LGSKSQGIGDRVYQLAGALFYSGDARRTLYARRVVHATEETTMESAQLDFWSGLDSALRHNGSLCVDGMEKWPVQNTASSADTLSCPTFLQFAMVPDLLWITQSVTRLSRYFIAVVDTGWDIGSFLEGGCYGSPVAGPLWGMGNLRGGP